MEGKVMKRKMFLLVILLSVFVTGILCAPAVAGPKKADKPLAPTVLRISMYAADKGTLDPHFAATDMDRAVVDMVFNGLVRYKPGRAPSIEPDLAESIPEPAIVDGRQVWTFKLRKGVMFHPGPKTKAYELTADDVVYSLEKSADPKRSAYAGEYTGMVFEKIDKYTVKITLKTPISSILFLPKISDYAGGFIVSKKAIEVMGDKAFKSNPVGTGPFTFKSYTPGKKVRLIANERYFRGRPALDIVEFMFVPEISNREARLKSGELDAIYGLREDRWIEKMRQEGIIVDVFGVGDVTTAFFNASVEPLNDMRVRKAIAYALDRDEFLARFDSESVGANIYSPVPSQLLPGGLSEKEAKTLGLDFGVNLEKSKKLLAEAGYIDGFSLEVVTSEVDFYRMVYEIMKEQLSKVGIDIKIKVVDHPTMHRLIRQNINPIVIYVAWRPNADVYLTRFFHSDSIVVTGAKPDTNFSHYDKINKLIEAARFETHPGKQIELWKQAQIKILSDMVAYPLFYRNQAYARRAYVDYGHKLINSMAYYPQITEKTRIKSKKTEVRSQ